MAGKFSTTSGAKSLFDVNFLLYIDKFAPFHNKMSVFHNIFVKFLQTIYFYKAESARKIDAQVNFNIQDVSRDIWGRKVNFWTKKYKKKILDPRILPQNYRFFRPHQICSEQYGPSKQGNL